MTARECKRSYKKALRRWRKGFKRVSRAYDRDWVYSYRMPKA